VLSIRLAVLTGESECETMIRRVEKHTQSRTGVSEQLEAASLAAKNPGGHRTTMKTYPEPESARAKSSETSCHARLSRRVKGSIDSL
jgi:hypothetical protein